MTILLPRFTTRRFAAAVAIAALPLAAFGWGLPIGHQPENDTPRDASPAASAGAVDYQAGTEYYAATTAHQRALYYCDRKPIQLQDACRDAADARYGYPSERYTESYPGYMTYYYPYPGGPVHWRDGGYAPGQQHYAYSAYPAYVYSPSYVYSPDSSATFDNSELDRCAPAYGAGSSNCLHGTDHGG
jgi:hypothetical protein